MSARRYPSDAVSGRVTGASAAAAQAFAGTCAEAAVVVLRARAPTGRTRTVRTASLPAASLAAWMIRAVIRRSWVA